MRLNLFPESALILVYVCELNVYGAYDKKEFSLKTDFKGDAI
jgi:hypothetical protein